MNRRKIFLCVMVVSVFINAVIFVIMTLCGFEAKFSLVSLVFAPVVLLYAFIGVYIYYRRHEEDVRYMSTWQQSFQDMHPYIKLPEVDTYSKEYMDTFTLHFCIFWFMFPFMITYELYVSLSLHILWIFPLFFIPLEIAAINEDRTMRKKYKIQRQKEAEELEEQKKREEMGHIK